MCHPDIEHPSHSISSDAAATLQQHTQAAETLGHLHPAQLEVFYSQRWFKLFVPRAYGGLALSLPAGVRIEEGIAWADGSAGWVATLCSGASWFAGFLPEAVRSQFLDNPEACFAGSGAPTGTADIADAGFVINGDWLYATGLHHATVFTANCIIRKDGVVQTETDGAPVIRPFILLRNEVVIHPSWKAIGMIATGSHAFSVRDLPVSPDRCFRIDGDFATLKDIVYQYPFQALAETTLAANHAGMAIRFIDLSEALFADRAQYSRSHTDAQGVMLQQKIAAARNTIDAARSAFYNTLDQSWQHCIAGNIPEPVLTQIRTVSQRLASISLREVDSLYPYGGLRAANPETEINRVWRNLHTASQHFLLVY